MFHQLYVSLVCWPWEWPFCGSFSVLASCFLSIHINSVFLWLQSPPENVKAMVSVNWTLNFQWRRGSSIAPTNLTTRPLSLPSPHKTLSWMMFQSCLWLHGRWLVSQLEWTQAQYCNCAHWIELWRQMHLGLAPVLNYATYLLSDLAWFLKISPRLGFLIDRRDGNNVNFM